MKYFKFLVASALYVVVLIAAYVIHVKFFRVNVVFYSSIADAVIATLLTIAIVSLVRWLNVFNAFEKTLLACIWLLLGYGFAISSRMVASSSRRSGISLQRRVVISAPTSCPKSGY